MTEIEKLKKLTGESDDALLFLLLEEAEAFVLAYTNRTKLVSGLYKPVLDLAVISLNRMGTEGENSRSGAGEAYNFETAPRQVYDIMDRYRLARIGGKAYEAKT